MHTSRTLKRWIALVILAALAFAQASIAATACEVERRTLSHAVASMAVEGCEARSIGNAPLHNNRCLAHCTADLQIAGLPVAIVRGAADVPVLFARPRTLSFVYDRFESPPPAGVPIRILLHSFLV